VLGLNRQNENNSVCSSGFLGFLLLAKTGELTMKETVLGKHAYAVLSGKGIELFCKRSVCQKPLKVGDRIVTIDSNQGHKVKRFHKACYVGMLI
jgi:hypothetical protein